ncbi:hypothetical protein C8F01DRAFT_1253118 [Mycena amicta]|nr:hypothetical protein C8F01DRAFT_1253118 [Mycena amicta]
MAGRTLSTTDARSIDKWIANWAFHHMRLSRASIVRASGSVCFIRTTPTARNSSESSISAIRMPLKASSRYALPSLETSLTVYFHEDFTSSSLRISARLPCQHP